MQCPQAAVAPKTSGHAPTATLGSCAGAGALGASPRARGPCRGGHSRGPDIPQAAPRVSTASIAARSATAPTGAAATASTGPASATRGSTAASATWVSPTACRWPAARCQAVTLCLTATVWLGCDCFHLQMRIGGLSEVPRLEREVLPGSLDSKPCPLDAGPQGVWAVVPSPMGGQASFEAFRVPGLSWPRCFLVARATPEPPVGSPLPQPVPRHLGRGGAVEKRWMTISGLVPAAPYSALEKGHSERKSRDPKNFLVGTWGDPGPAPALHRDLVSRL